MQALRQRPVRLAAPCGRRPWDFNFSNKVAQEAKDALGPSVVQTLGRLVFEKPLPASQLLFVFCIMEKNMHRSHYQHGQGVHWLQYDCIVATMQEVVDEAGSDLENLYLLPRGHFNGASCMHCARCASLALCECFLLHPQFQEFLFRMKCAAGLGILERIRSTLSPVAATSIEEAKSLELAEVMVLLQEQG